MGVLVVRQEGEKLYAVPPNGQTVELVPDATVDKFAAQAVGASVRFERDTSGKVIGIAITMPDGHEVKGRKSL